MLDRPIAHSNDNKADKTARHLSALRKKHAVLDEEIIALEGKPAYCSLEMQALKRRKLELKDKIHGLEEATS